VPAQPVATHWRGGKSSRQPAEHRGRERWQAVAPSLLGSALPSVEPGKSHRESLMDERACLHRPGLTSAQARGILLLLTCTLPGPLGTGVMPQVKGSLCVPGSGLSPGGMMGVKATAEEATDECEERVSSP